MARDVKERVLKGLSSQDAVASYIFAEARDLGFRARIMSKAKFGQKGNDVVISIDGMKYNIEVKGTAGANKPISMFDKSVRRRNVPREIDKITEAFASVISVGGASLNRLMQVNSYQTGFLGVMDFYRDKIDPAIGLAEDANSPPSGKIPRDFISRDTSVCTAARNIILANLKAGEDTYFAVHDKGTDDVRFWYTGYGTNVLQAKRFPSIKEIALDTYGGASLGATRIALKIRI